MSVLVVAALPTLLACSTEPPGAEVPSDTVESDPAVAAPATGAPTPADTAAWTVGATSAPSTAAVPPTPVVTAVRTGTHPEHARVTFEFADAGGSGDAGPAYGGRPGYRVRYVDRPLRDCGSGRQIFPVGDGWLEIRLDPAAGHTEEGETTLGPREVDVEGPLLRRIYRTCDFEGLVTHVLALESPNAYRVFTLEAPLRIVVDVRR